MLIINKGHNIKSLLDSAFQDSVTLLLINLLSYLRRQIHPIHTMHRRASIRTASPVIIPIDRTEKIRRGTHLAHRKHVFPYQKNAKIRKISFQRVGAD